VNKIAAEAHDEWVRAKNASNQSGGSITGEKFNTLGYLTTTTYPSYTTSSKKTIRTTTTVREYNDAGLLVRETETIVEEETNPTTTYPQIYNGILGAVPA